MKKTILTFGLISGGISAVMMLLTLPFVDKIGFDKGEVLGYTLIVVSALFIFFGVRSYRENAGGGKITFGRGFAVGILITLIANFCYVATWEVLYFKFMPDFGDKYAAYAVEKAKKSGASPEKIQQTERQMAQFTQEYKSFPVNVGYTFLEVFPIGLVVTLISAALLRRKIAPQPA